jgi:hypothetical protein
MHDDEAGVEFGVNTRLRRTESRLDPCHVSLSALGGRRIFASKP